MANGDLILRDLRTDDRSGIARILAGVGVFHDHEVTIGLELVDETLDPGPSTDYQWVVADREGVVVGFACYGPIPLTEGTFDLYWIAVEPEARGSGVAASLDLAVTRSVQEQGGRWLLAETSSRPDYASAHKFYLKQGYRLLERIEDFYQVGDARITFGKRLDQG